MSLQSTFLIRLELERSARLPVVRAKKKKKKLLLNSVVFHVLFRFGGGVVHLYLESVKHFNTSCFKRKNVNVLNQITALEQFQGDF